MEYRKLGAVIGMAISIASQVVGNIMSGEKASAGVLMAAVTGAASGALAAGTLGKWGQALANAGISLVAESINQITKGTLNTKNGVRAVVKATGAGFIGGYIGGAGMRNKRSTYYKAAKSAKITAEKVFNKTYSNPKTPLKLLSRAIKIVKKVGFEESIKTGKTFALGSIGAQLLTRISLLY